MAGEGDAEESEVEDRFRIKIAAALELPGDHPIVAGWFRSHQALVSRVHWRKTSPSTQEIRESFVALVDLLFGRIAPYFDTQAELDRLLALDAPSEEDVARLIRCTVRYTQRQYFFTRLAKSGWLRPLAKAGVFRNPPAQRKHDDGSWSIQAWPEGEALARLASAEPEIAVAELSALPKDNDNPAIWNVVADAAMALTPADAARMVPLLVHALKNVPPVLFPKGVIGVIQKLASAGAREAAFSLTETLLFVKGARKEKPAAGLTAEET